MGRKPNPLILEYFVRGPKLNDNSNRYPHTCKQCGESFPKGRIDSLTTHITKKCPAISDSERMRACLELHGIAHPRPAHGHVNHSVNTSHAGQVDVPMQDLPQGWSALETLAEASRQVDLNEHSRTQTGQTNSAVSPVNPTNGEVGTDRFELQEQFTLDNPPTNVDSRAQNGRKDATPPPPTGLTPEERLQALLPENTSSPDVANLSVAVAAAARMNTSFLDPDLGSGGTSETTTTGPAQNEDLPMTDADTAPITTLAAPNTSQPWGEMTYIANAGAAPFLSEPPITPMPLNRGGVRMDTSDMLFNGRPRHARAQFSPSRRKEVQEVRKIGACIRCRILRKTCGKGSPCDTCRKVLSPRVWKVGCVRTKLHEQLDIYSAGVQVVLSQNRINLLKESLNPFSNGTIIELTHFPDVPLHMTAPTLVAPLPPSDGQAEPRESKEEPLHVIMIDQDGQDIPGKVEEYTRSVLPLLIEREPSKFTRVILETAQRELNQEDDEVLKKSLELWGLVETIDRERQWTVWRKPSAEGEKEEVITESNGGDEAQIYTMICMQVNAAAERRANKTSRDILGLMQRFLQDSKMKIGFRMYLTALILLNCVEKSTWAFKAWEQDHLRPGWPLEREPGDYTQQGSNLAGLLKMLLAIRKALPLTARSDEGKLVTKEENEEVVKFFESIDLDYDFVEARQQGLQFSPADSRSLELAFCSHLLLPTTAS